MMASHWTKRQILQGASLAGALGLAYTPQALAQRTAARADTSRRDSIARVTAYPIVVPCRLQVGGYKRDIRMGGTVVEVETGDGLTGLGFTSITNSEVVAAAVNLVAAPALKGADAINREAVATQLHQLLTPRGQTGHAQHAISAIDIALWDILGKRLDMPIWRLLGGARSSVPSYTTFGMAYMSRDELAAAAKYLAKAGRQRLKMVVAAGAHGRIAKGEAIERILDEDVERIRAVREAAGPAVELYIDGNHGLDEYQTRRFIKRIEEFDIAFFEEPVSGNEVTRLSDLRKVSPIAIAAGQNETHIRRLRDFIISDAVDVLQFNTCMCGGYTGALKVAGLAAAFGMEIDNGGGYGEYNMHLHAGVANGGMIEWHLGSVALGSVLYKDFPQLDGDRMPLPDAPGLGFSVDMNVVREHEVKS
jgi:L-alanine-DL-glutamate epimerase-like enolase superfamily enzyme